MIRNRKKTFIILFAFLFITGCNKKYTYVEEIIDKGVLGDLNERTTKEPKTIWAKSDTAAYLEAFELFSENQYIYDKAVADGLYWWDVPVGFHLYTSDGIDISDIEFSSKKWREDIITNMFKRLSDTNSSDNSNFGKIDSTRIKELLPLFDIEKDEFAPDGRVWYTPKSAPDVVWTNGIYLYFMVKDGKAQNLRLKVQYYDDDWLFLKKLYFSIDSNAYLYKPQDVKSDNGRGGMIWEWFDEKMYRDDKVLLDALSKAKSAKMKFVGDKYHHIRTISAEQIESIKNTLELYFLLGGTL